MRRKKKVMVCVTQQKSCERLIDYGAGQIVSEHDELYVVHILKENWKYFGQLKEADALEYLFDVSKSHHASLSVIKAKDIEKALSEFVDKYRISNVVMGESFEKDEQQNMINRLQERIKEKVNFHIVPLNLEDETEVITIEKVTT